MEKMTEKCGSDNDHTDEKNEPQFLLGADAERIAQRWGQTHQVWFGEQDDHPEKGQRCFRSASG